MKRFKQYLIERLDNEMDSVPTSATQKPKDLVAPNRRDYADTPEGAEQWKSDTRDFASKTKSQAELETEQAKSNYDTLGKVETGLKIADTAADTALSAGAVAVPGVGTALNAGVKMLKAGINASQGENTKAAMNVIDAALPVAGELAAGLKGAQLVGKVASSPITTGVEKAAEAAGVMGKAVKDVAGSTSVLSSTGQQFLGNVATKTATKLAGKELENKLASNSGTSVQPTTQPTPVTTAMSSSSSNFRGKTNIPKA